MGWRKSICKVLWDGASQSIHPATPTCSYLAAPNASDSLLVCRFPLLRGERGLDGRKRSPAKESLLHTSQRGLDGSKRSPEKESLLLRSKFGTNLCGGFSGEVVALRSQMRNFSGTMEACRISSPLISSTRTAGIHAGRTADAPPVEPTYGVGPVRGADRDPESKGDTPDDFRADAIHMAEPKEITKEKAAVAQEEPPDFQVKKLTPEWDRPALEEADSQREPGDKVFEGKTRKLEGTAQYEGDTTGNETNEKVEAQYGAGSAEGKTSRA